jgi:hypothetical protein
MYRPGTGPEAGTVSTDESSPTFPDPLDADERALRRDLVLLTRQHRRRRRGRRV